jgi:hypothetical protein
MSDVLHGLLSDRLHRTHSTRSWPASVVPQSWIGPGMRASRKRFRYAGFGRWCASRSECWGSLFPVSFNESLSQSEFLRLKWFSSLGWSSSPTAQSVGRCNAHPSWHPQQFWALPTYRSSAGLNALWAPMTWTASVPSGAVEFSQPATWSLQKSSETRPSTHPQIFRIHGWQFCLLR